MTRTHTPLPEIEPYGRGTNGTRVTLSASNGDSLSLWYSYKTCVAFAKNGARVVHENIWSKTTGRHLAEIDGGSESAKAERVGAEAFEAALGEALAGFGA